MSVKVYWLNYGILEVISKCTYNILPAFSCIVLC